MPSRSLTILSSLASFNSTGEHVDLSDLALVGAQLALVKAIKQTGVPTVVVFVSGKPVAEPWIADNAVKHAFIVCDCRLQWPY